MLTRIGWFSDPLQSLAPTSLVGLFFGSILGVWVRETLLVLLGRHTSVLPRQSERFFVQWMIRHPIPKERSLLFWEPGFLLFYFFLILLLGQFLQSFGMSWKEGLGVPEYLYFPTVSSREYFAQSANLFVSLCLPILYFLSEERTSTQNFPENMQAHFLFGLALGLVIQWIVMLVQTLFLPDFFSAGSNLSLVVRRVPGLFLDSGSASWILPTISLFLMRIIWSKIREAKERIFILPFIIILVLNSYLGLRLGKAFWVIWICGLFIFFLYEVTNQIESEKKKFQVRILSFLVLALAFFPILALFSFLPASSSLQRLGALTTAFFQSLWSGEGLHTLRIWDPNRYDMTLVAWENFLQSPFWGNGWASYLMTLKNPDRIGTVLETDFYDSPPNFYLGLLQDIGIYGSIFFFCILGYTVWLKNSASTALLLFLPFFFGTQIQHPDGSFFAVFLLFFARKETESVAKFSAKRWFYPSIMILALGVPLHFLLHDIEKSWEKGIGADFREKELGFYQIGAYEWAGFSGSQHHKFQGKVFEWKTVPVKNKGRTKLELIGSIPESENVTLLFFNVEKQAVLNPEDVQVNIEKERTILTTKVPLETAYVRLVAKSWIKFQLKKRDFDTENRLFLD